MDRGAYVAGGEVADGSAALRLTYPNEPNPVAAIIRTRTLRILPPVALLLLGAYLWLPRLWFFGAILGGTLVVGGLLSLYFVRIFDPTFGWGYPIERQLPREEMSDRNRIALTFDDGPHPETTPAILDVFKEQGGTATFFLLGEQVVEYPEIVKRIVDEGHSVGIHGFRHRSMVLQSASEIEADIGKTIDAIEAATGKKMLAGNILLRPPYGFTTWTVCRTASRLCCRLVGWSVDPRDYDTLPAAVLATRVLQAVKPDCIVLLHERPGDPATVVALKVVLADLRRRGLKLIAIE